MKLKTLSKIVGTMSLSLCSLSAHSAGFALIEHSASGLGNAFSGAAAVADDGSTIFFNPAGMTELDDEQFSGALHWIRPRGSFSNDGSETADGQTLAGSDSHNKGVDAVVPNLYYHKRLPGEVVFGLGINAPFGLESTYNDTWVGRYHAVNSKMISLNVNPSLAWKVNDKVSFGAGVNVQYIHVELSSAVDFGSLCQGILTPEACTSMGVLPQQMDGFAVLEADSVDWGYNFGMLFKPQKGTHIGLAHRSRVNHVAEGDADFTVPGEMDFVTSSNIFVDTGLTAKVTLPDTTSVSISHEIDKATLLFDWTYTRWSSFDELRIQYDSAQPDSVTTENWGNSNRYSVGLNYQYSPRMTIRTGFAYDETPVPDEAHRTPRLPGNDRTWIAVGLGYQLDRTLGFDIGYAHLNIKEAPSDNQLESSIGTLQHHLRGSYDSKVDILSVQLNWTF